MRLLSWVIFRKKPLFFRLERRFGFLLDFSSILEGFWKGFGRVLGGPKGRKIEILDGFLNMLFEPIILVKIYLIFNKIDGEKHMDFVLFFVLLFVFF